MKKYTHTEIAVIIIAIDEYYAILPNTVNFFNIVNGNSNTPSKIFTIYVLFTVNLHIVLKNYVIPLDPIIIYAAIIPNV